MQNSTGIVILNFNSYKLTCELVIKCLSFDFFSYVVLVDNASEDDFSEFVNEVNNSKLIYHQNEQNVGYAAGNNVGLKILKEKKCHIGFIANPDVILGLDSIVLISDFLEKNKDYAVASCSRSGANGKITRQYWNLPNYFHACLESLYLFRRYFEKRMVYISNKVVNDKKESGYIDVDVVGGAFFGCQLSILEEINYLDENTFLWYEENILSHKLHMAGYKVACLTSCHYVHNHLKKGHGNKNIHFFFNSKKYYCKTCLNISRLQMNILCLFDFVGNIEEKIICKIFKR